MPKVATKYLKSKDIRLHLCQKGKGQKEQWLQALVISHAESHLTVWDSPRG